MHAWHADRSTYTGFGAHPFAPHHPGPAMHLLGPGGFCRSCCHPAQSCCCARRECRKEARELLVQPTQGRDQVKADSTLRRVASRAAFFRPFAAAFADEQDADAKLDAARFPAAAIREAAAAPLSVGQGKAFIGGSCCVHLSIEYAPTTPTAPSIVVVFVDDTSLTAMAWAKMEQPGAGYQVKECIITTRPGADLTVMLVNMTARVRWCEVFSC